MKLTFTPGEMTEADVIKLRDIGFNDEEISIATQVTAYFNYINRIADGLGVDDEKWMDLPKDEWHDKKGSRYLESLSSD